MNKVVLDTGIEVEVPTKFEYVTCRDCKAKNLIWAKTKNGKFILVRWSSTGQWVNHLEECSSKKRG